MNNPQMTQKAALDKIMESWATQPPGTHVKSKGKRQRPKSKSNLQVINEQTH
jgi:hypothetical protein